MELTYRELENQVRLIELSGQLDVVGVGQVETRFAGHCSGDNLHVLVDMSAVAFMASIGIRMLILNAKSVARRGGKMALIVPAGKVRETLELAAIDNVLPIFDDLDSALAKTG
jgi:anti-sigma B factor antagonist